MPRGVCKRPLRVAIKTQLYRGFVIALMRANTTLRLNRIGPVMFEVILYAALATIVCVVMYTVLGKSVGRGPGEDAVELFRPGTPDTPKMVEPVLQTSSVPGMNDIFKLDRSFNMANFTDGAKTAYVMILEAFASGDKDTLRNLLSDNVYAAYEGAIDAREAEGLRQITDLGRLKGAKIVAGETDGKWMRVSVQYSAELASSLVNSDDEVVQGDPDVLANIAEVWTFTRKAGASDPTWLLDDVAPSEGDDLEADPTPDTKATDTQVESSSSTVKKPSAKKTVAKKPAAKKPVSKKPTTQKPAAKKPSDKKP